MKGRTLRPRRTTLAVEAKVLDALRDADRALRPDEVFVQLPKGAFSRGGLYRLMGQMHQRGQLSRYFGTGGWILYGLREGARRLTLRCERCGSSTLVEDPVLSESVDRVAADQGFALTPEAIYLNGECAACVQNRTRSSV